MIALQAAIWWGPDDGLAWGHWNPTKLAGALSRRPDPDLWDDPMHVYTLRKRLTKLFHECGWETLADISGEDFCRWRESTPLGKNRVPVRGPVTLNQWLKALHHFCQWATGKRIARNPVADVELVEVTGGIRRKRRALTDEQAADLIDAVHRVLPDHEDVYLVAMGTGLRRGELAALTWEDVRLDCTIPHLRLRAETTKGRREDTPALHDYVASVLRARRARAEGAQEGGKVFSAMPTMEEHRACLEEAKIPYRDSKGRQLDFHAMRVHFGTVLAKAGVSVRDAMGLLRHRSEKLTSQVYVDAAETVAGLGVAVNRISLPAIPKGAAQQATGTDTDVVSWGGYMGGKLGPSGASTGFVRPVGRT